MPDTREGGNGRNLSVRLPSDLLDKVVGLAKVDGVTMGEVIRHAIVVYSEQRTKDPDFAERVDATKRQLEALLPRP